jgi:hypothetical protein
VWWFFASQPRQAAGVLKDRGAGFISRLGAVS